MSKLVESGEDVTLELESELGISRIEGASLFNLFHKPGAEMPGFSLNQGGARYIWDGQTAFGMMERSEYTDKLRG